MAVSVLIVEDDRNIAELLQMYLEKEGYAVTCAHDGGQGLQKFRAIRPDLVLLDVMMPVMDGISATLKIREKSNVPIIFLSAKSEDTDKIAGLGFGGDDYVTKPFSPTELLARVDSLYRRVSKTSSAQKPSTKITSGRFVLDLRSRSLSKDGRNIELTQVEFQIMEYFFANPNVPIGRSVILHKVWGDAYFGEEKMKPI